MRLLLLLLACSSLENGTKPLPALQVPLQTVDLTSGPIPDELVVAVTIDGHEDILLRIDSAAPDTTMPNDQLSALGLAAGSHDFWIGSPSSGLHLGARMLKHLEQTGTGPLPSGSVLSGTAGNDLWAGLAIGLDLRGQSLWLTAPKGALSGNELLHPDGTGAVIAVPAEHVHHQSGDAGALFAAVSLGSAQGQFLVDTGTNSDLVLGPYWAKVQAASTRSMPLDVADFMGTPLPAAYRLAPALALGGHQLAGLSPILEVDSFPVLDGEGQYFNHAVDGLLSLWGLWGAFTVLDFASPEGPADQPRLFLFPYQPAAPSVLAENFTGFGLVFGQSEMHVAIGSDAQMKGVQDGDQLVSVGGGPYQFLSTGIVAGKAGESRPFTLSRNGTNYSVSILAEPLLGP
jgi:hypothetical protein